MTTTNDVHPMVMKAAKLQFECDCGVAADDSSEVWRQSVGLYVRDAQRVLNECGALECLEALEGLHDMVLSDAYRASDVLKSTEAIGKVYGSAPE